jgi:hypothetical protein
VHQVEGYLSTGTFDDLLAWYDETIAAVPLTGSWFPVSAPVPSAEALVINGVKSTRYNVSMTVLQIL